MIVSKYQAKQLRYLARANYGATYTAVEGKDSSTKVKHREFPCFELSYDESKVSNGIELTNVLVSGNPFSGTYDELLDRLKSVGTTDDTVHIDMPVVLQAPVQAIDLTCDVSAAEPTEQDIPVESPIVCDAEIVVAPECNDPGIVKDTVRVKPAMSNRELNDLRIKCAVMKLAVIYGEPKDTAISDLVIKYPDAVQTLSTLYATDKISCYAISEDSLREAYPNEFKAIMGE